MLVAYGNPETIPGAALGLKDREALVGLLVTKPVPVGPLKIIESLRVGSPRTFVEEREVGFLFPAGQQLAQVVAAEWLLALLVPLLVQGQGLVFQRKRLHPAILPSKTRCSAVGWSRNL